MSWETRKARDLVNGDRFRLFDGARERSFARSADDDNVVVYRSRMRGPDAPTGLLHLPPDMDVDVWVEPQPAARASGRPTKAWPQDRRGHVVGEGDVVQLDEGYAEHPDNVGTVRRGPVVTIGKGDWDGFVRVAFVGVAKPHWVPASTVTVLTGRVDALMMVLIGQAVTPELREALVTLGVTDAEIDSAVAKLVELMPAVVDSIVEQRRGEA